MVEDGNEEDSMADHTNKKLTAIFSAEQSAMKKKVYLEQNELSVKSTFEYEDLDVIYANEKVSLCSCDVLICSYLSNFPIYLHFPHQYRSLLYTTMPYCLTQQTPTRKVCWSLIYHAPEFMWLGT